MTRWIGILAPVSLILFVYSGMLKWLPWPVDPTILFGSFVAGFLLLKLMSEPARVPRESMFLLFVVPLFLIFYVLTALYTISPKFWEQKAILQLLNILAFSGGYLLLRQVKEHDNAVLALTLFALTAFALLLFMILSGRIDVVLPIGLDRETSRLPDYLGIGTLLGCGILVLSRWQTRWGYALMAAMFFVLFQLGARGPTVFVLLVLVSHLLIGQLITSQRGVRSVLALSILAIPLLMIFTTPIMKNLFESRFFARMQGLLIDSQSVENAFRFDVFEKALFVANDYIIMGTGIGGFGMAGYNEDDSHSPHNIILEVAVEAGLVGLILFLVGLLRLVGISLKYRYHRSVFTSLMLLSFIMLNYMKSGSFLGARDIYFFLGMTLAAHDIARREYFARLRIVRMH